MNEYYTTGYRNYKSKSVIGSQLAAIGLTTRLGIPIVSKLSFLKFIVTVTYLFNPVHSLTGAS